MGLDNAPAGNADVMSVWIYVVLLPYTFMEWSSAQQSWWS
jgi:hypothetical protein